MEKKGGRGGRGFFSVQGYVLLPLYEFSRIYLLACSVTPCLNQVFRRCFSMEHLRAYVEDGSQSPSVQAQVAKRPNTSTGLSTSSSTSSTSSTVPSTRTLSGPVPEVSAPTQSPSVVPQDKTVSLKDIPPPPPPDEPYELFLARVACQMADPSGGPPRPAAAGPVQPPQQLPTVGLRLPTPFPRFEDTTWASIPQVQGPRIRMPLPSSCYAPPPQPWTWSGRGPDVPTLQVRSHAPLLSSTGPIRFPGPTTLAGGPPTEGPLPPLPPTTSSSVSKNAVSTPPPALSQIFSGGHAPFCPEGGYDQRDCCSSPDDSAYWWERSSRTSASFGPGLEGTDIRGHATVLETVAGWRSTPVNCRSRCSPGEHGPRRTAAAESLWRPRGVMGSA